MESFTLLLQSANSSNRTGSSTSAYTYDVNWDAIIPSKYKNRQFNVSFTFFSTPQATNQDITQISINYSGKTGLYNQSTSNTNIVGVAVPVVYTQGTEYSYLMADVNTNSSFSSGYPSSNYITVNLYENATYLTAPNPAIYDYSLFLKFTLI
jgi:hypothetical protein